MRYFSEYFMLEALVGNVNIEIYVFVWNTQEYYLHLNCILKAISMAMAIIFNDEMTQKNNGKKSDPRRKPSVL